MIACQCEQNAHFPDEKALTPEGKIGHAYGAERTSNIAVRTGSGTFHVCQACALDCYAEFFRPPAIGYADEFWQQTMTGDGDPIPVSPAQTVKVTFPCFVNIVLRNRSYGGPEEGGWWYDTAERISSHQANNQEALDRMLGHLRVRYNNMDRLPVSSVASPGEFAIVISREPVANFEPQQTPHYE